MMKKVGIIKRRIAICLIFLMCINSFAAVVSDNDGSAFITKAEFDSLKNNFQSQIDTYNQSIDSKIDGAIASYLSGISVSKTSTHKSLFDSMGVTLKGYKGFQVIGNNCKRWFVQTWASGNPHGDFDVEPRVAMEYNLSFATTYGGSLSSRYWRNGTWNLNYDITRDGGGGTNISAEGSGVDIDRIRYGQRTILTYTTFYYVGLKADAWWGMYPRWISTSSDAGFQLHLASAQPNYTAFATSGSGAIGWSSGNIATYKNWIGLRDNVGNVSYPSYTPPREMLHGDGTYSTTNWSWCDPDKYNWGSWFTQSASTRYNYVLNSVPSDYFGDNMLYFFPGGGARKIFVMDQSNIKSNFKKFELPKKPDGSLYQWNEKTELGLTYNKYAFFMNFDSELEDLARAQGLTVLDSAKTGYVKDSEVPVFIDGTFYDYDTENRRLPLSTLRYSQPTAQLGKDVTIGEAPLIIHDAEKTGTITIDGGGLTPTYYNASYAAGPSKKVIVAFTKTGAVNEVDLGTGGSPNWTIENTIPFEYKTATGGSWTHATDNKLILDVLPATPDYNFRFNVDKGDDIYMHWVCPDYRDDQNVTVIVRSDTYCTLEAED